MNPRIQSDPNICHGKPVIRGTRVLVSTILGTLNGGDGIETLLEDYPNITREEVEAALEFASRLSDYQASSDSRIQSAAPGALSPTSARVFSPPPVVAGTSSRVSGHCMFIG